MLKLVWGREKTIVLILGLVLFSASLLVNTPNRNRCDAQCLSRTPTIGLVVMPPNNDVLSRRGFPMPVATVSIDADSLPSRYESYSGVAVIVDLAAAFIVAWLIVSALTRLRTKPTK